MRNVLLVFALLATLVAMPSVAEASLQAGDTIEFTRTAGTFSGSGGEFKAVVNNDAGNTFQTFCLELGQTVNPNGTEYDVHSVYQNSITGANGGQSVDPIYGPLLSDPVSGETAWLYLQFWNEVQLGQSSALNYLTVGTRSTNAGLLQNAIWNLEGENVGVGGNGYYAAAVAASQAEKDAALAVVRAVNPINKNSDGTVAGNHRQSMLYVIPEPVSLAVWGGLIAAVALRRRRRQ